MHLIKGVAQSTVASLTHPHAVPNLNFHFNNSAFVERHFLFYFLVKKCNQLSFVIYSKKKKIVSLINVIRHSKMGQLLTV